MEFEEPLTAFQLKQEAAKLQLDKQWARAETIYLQLIEHPTHANELATPNGFRYNIAKCRVQLGRFEEACDILLTMCDEIVRHDHDLLKWVIPKYLKQAYVCYRLGGLTEKCEQVLKHPRLTDWDRQRLLKIPSNNISYIAQYMMLSIT